MSGKVYVVTAGEYSAYRIVACFDNEAAAQACVEVTRREETYIGDTASIEEYELLAEPIRERQYEYSIIDHPGYGPRSEGGKDHLVWGHAVESVEDARGSEHQVVGVDSWAASAERARKIAHDREAFQRARAEGLA